MESPDGLGEKMTKLLVFLISPSYKKEKSRVTPVHISDCYLGELTWQGAANNHGVMLGWQSLVNCARLKSGWLLPRGFESLPQRHTRYPLSYLSIQEEVKAYGTK